MELKKERTQAVALDVLVNGEVTSYACYVLFTFGIKEGETPYQRWRITESRMTVEEADAVVRYFISDGYEARIVKITTKAEVIE